uniref:Uncharacterized protein n=1 Tax=Oryza glumipatula TaxID=40148 RepID=A0A0D9YCM4_9ORYZ
MPLNPSESQTVLPPIQTRRWTRGAVTAMWGPGAVWPELARAWEPAKQGVRPFLSRPRGDVAFSGFGFPPSWREGGLKARILCIKPRSLLGEELCVVGADEDGMPPGLNLIGALRVLLT